MARHGTQSCYTHDKCRCDLCKAAAAAYQKEYRATHRQERREKRIAYAAAHPGENAARAAAWRKQYPEHVRERRRAYNVAHREEQAAKVREWRLKNPDKVKAHNWAHRYGITLAARQELVERQGGMCASGCGRPATDLDHDHVTGRVRGVLCHPCNAVLGYAFDDPFVLRNLIAYLAFHAAAYEVVA